MRIASWNLWHEPTQVQERLVVAASALQHLHPDVICLQEVRQQPGEPSTAQTLAEHLDMACLETFLGTKHEPGTNKPYDVGLAILSKNPATGHHTHRFTGVDGCSEPRGVIAATIAGTNHTFLIINTHLAWGAARETQRYEQTREIDHLANVWAGEQPDMYNPHAHTPIVVLTGDMNSEHGDSIAYLRGERVWNNTSTYWTDSVQAGGEHGPTVAPAVNIWAQQMSKTTNTHYPARRIDHVYTRGWAWGRPGETQHAGRIGMFPQGGILASDHYGVWVELAE